jgi:hypothetical protein
MPRRPRTDPIMAMLPGTPAVWLAVACSLSLSIAAAAPPAPQPQRTDLITDMPAAGDLAAPANGQTLYILDETRGEVVAIDPFEPTKRWTAVAAGTGRAAAAGPLAIGCIDTSMLVSLCHASGGWSLQTHRLQPGTAADCDKPTQTVAIGKAAGDAAAAAPKTNADRPSGDVTAFLAVSPSRDWLGVCGLPAPLPAVMRAPIAGARIGGMSARNCPVIPADLRPAAATISPADEFVIFSREQADRSAASVFVSFYLPPDPRRLLHLDTSLPRIRDACFCRADGTLWVVGGGPPGETIEETAAAGVPEGLWRIDAVLRNGRQSAEAVCVARLEGARAVVCLSERIIIVTHGRDARVVSQIDPTQPASKP